MPVTTVQTAQDNWRRRSNTFRAAGIPDSTWSQLYQRDMTGVYAGSQPMSDAEIYTAVKSSAQGPQIQDPQAQHGHGGGLFGVLDTVANVVGNIPRDVGGIITGFPHGLAHAVWDLPQEIPDTWNLITHLGDNQWMIKNGYLQPGDKAHGLWGDFGQILREMNAKQSSNLLPYLPFLSDIANMTTGKGRAYLMQHPVGSMLDAWPAASWGGKLATAGRSFIPGITAEEWGQMSKGAKSTALRDYPRDRSIAKNLASGDPKFYAAGRALQAGNPLKAGISALGDILPGGVDEAGLKMTARDRALHIANLMGISAPERSLVAGVSIGDQEVKSGGDQILKQNFGDLNISPELREELGWGMAHINPVTKEPMTTDEYNAWVDSLPPELRGARSVFQNVAEAYRQWAQANGVMKGWTEPGKDGKRGQHMLEPFNSPVYKAWDKFHQADIAYEMAVTKFKDSPNLLGTGQIGVMNKELNDLFAVKEKAWQDYNSVKANDIPLRGVPTAAAIFRKQAIDTVKKHPERLGPGWTMTHDVGQAVEQLTKSTHFDEVERLLGPEATAKILADAVNEWKKIEAESGNVHFIGHVDEDHVKEMMNPHVDPTNRHLPEQFKGIGKGILLNRSVMDPVLALTYLQQELLRSDVADRFIEQHLQKAFLYSKDDITGQYEAALRKAVALGRMNLTPYEIAQRAQEMVKDNYTDWNPRDIGGTKPAPDQLIARDVKNQLEILLGKKSMWLQQATGNKVLRKGTALYKFAVLTGPRHLAHVAFGGLAFLELRLPFAPRQLLKASKLLRGEVDPKEFGLEGLTLSGLMTHPYQLGTPKLEQILQRAVGDRMGEDFNMEKLHEARQRGVSILEWLPNRLAKMEENIMNMYRVSAFLEARAKQIRGGRGVDLESALEEANKVFVDINNMSIMERQVIKQIFPFYAFTRHLFRYLFTYPVDYPLRASIITNFGEVEQNDWNNGLPRSYQSLLFMFHTKNDGSMWAVDTKNLNPFRSFSNDFSMAGFMSSLSPFVTAPLTAMGVDTLSGTTQLYPGAIFNPQTGSLQATAPPGGIITMAEAFVPQVGLLDHYFGLTAATRGMAKYSPDAYQKQLFNMLNVPFVPNVINVPYYQEITEIRRFRAAQAAVTAVEKYPSAANIAKLMEWNAVPFDNRLINPGVLAQYWQRVQAIMQAQGKGGIAPKAAVLPPPQRKAIFQNF